MARKTEIEQALADTLYVKRALIDLKHRLAARREKNDTLDDTSKKFMKHVQQGTMPSLKDLGDAFDA